MNEELKNYTILKDVTVNGIPYTSGQTQNFKEDDVKNLEEGAVVLSSEYAGSPEVETAEEVQEAESAEEAPDEAPAAPEEIPAEVPAEEAPEEVVL